MNTIFCTGRIVEGQIQWSISPLPQTDATPLVSDYMNRTCALGTSDDLFWDGYYGCCEGQELAEMPSEQQQLGWWHARLGGHQDELSEMRNARLDETFWREQL